MSENILVTGSKGFIGKKLISKLKNTYNIFEFSYSLGDDILDEKKFEKFLDEKIDIVFHLAGKTFVPGSWNNPNAFYETNVMGTQKVLDFCSKAKAKIVYLSSYCYGEPEYLPIDEKHPVKLQNPYAHSKYLAESLCEFYSKEMGVKSILLRLFNVYGESQKEDFLIPRIIKQAKQNNMVTVQDLRPKRDYVYIDDVIDACIKCIEFDNFKDNVEVFNIGSGESYSVEEVIKMIQNFTGNNFKYESTNQFRHNEIMNTIADISKAEQKLYWKPKISFEQGLENVIRAYE